MMRATYFAATALCVVSLHGEASAQSLQLENGSPLVRVLGIQGSENGVGIADWCKYAYFAEGQIPKECGGGRSVIVDQIDLSDFITNSDIFCTTGACVPVKDCTAGGCEGEYREVLIRRGRDVFRYNGAILQMPSFSD